MFVCFLNCLNWDNVESFNMSLIIDDYYNEEHALFRSMFESYAQ